MNKQNVKISDYLTLYTPALNFILQTGVYNAPDSLLDHIFNKCKNQTNQ